MSQPWFIEQNVPLYSEVLEPREVTAIGWAKQMHIGDSIRIRGRIKAECIKLALDVFYGRGAGQVRCEGEYVGDYRVWRTGQQQQEEE